MNDGARRLAGNGARGKAIRALRGSPGRTTIDESDAIPGRIRQQAIDMGLYGFALPIEHGGLGMTMTEEVQLVFELGYTTPAFRSMFGTNNGIAGHVLIEGGTDEQKRHLLPGLASGAVTAAFALTEAEAGSDPAGLVTRARRDSVEWVIDGANRHARHRAHRGAEHPQESRHGRARNPQGDSARHHPDEIIAMLDAVPDLRESLKTATPEKLSAIFRAFDVTVTYDKANQFLDLDAAILPELLPAPITESDHPEEQSPSRTDDIAGARSGRYPTTSLGETVAPIAYRIEEAWPIGRELADLQDILAHAKARGSALNGWAERLAA
jgi:hypothetical protein